MGNGFFVPLHTAHGTNCWTGFIGGKEIDFEVRSHLQQLGLYYSVAMLRLFNLENTLFVNKVLTTRQLECIKWIAQGKSDWEIASILGLSQATINRHVERAKERFGVATRMQVVVKAVQSGELILNQPPEHVFASIASTKKIRMAID